jgi:hypothetical protein
MRQANPAVGGGLAVGPKRFESVYHFHYLYVEIRRDN